MERAVDAKAGEKKGRGGAKAIEVVERTEDGSGKWGVMKTRAGW